MTTTSLPPFAKRSPVQWARENLFNNWYNALLTLGAVALIFYVVRGLLTWAFTEAEWDVIRVNFRLIIIGQYPIAQAWRLWIGMYMLAFIIGASLGLLAQYKWLKGILLSFPIALALLFPFGLSARLLILGLSAIGALAWFLAHRMPSVMRRPTLTGWILFFPVFILLVAGLTGPEGAFPRVGSNLWGGLLLTFLLTVVGILFSFPIGVMLALGRQSDLPLIKWFCIFYIETIRGVPLITILFMAQLMLPLFLPPNVTVDRVLRAMVGITMFSSAYLAENVRGGLQAIPNGQHEAAYALGLNGVQSTVFIILPQALRLVIPILVGQFIGLFKDTALVAIVGLFDLLGIADTVLAQPDFIGLQREVYIFISIIYWVLSYAMSYVSQRLEDYLGVGKR